MSLYLLLISFFSCLNIYFLFIFINVGRIDGGGDDDDEGSFDGGGDGLAAFM